MITQLDHISLVVRDLPAAVDGYATLLGRAPAWHSADDGAEQARFQLGNMALDIIAPVGDGSAGDRAHAQLEANGEGLWTIAFATADVEKARHKFERRGIASMAARVIRLTDVHSNQVRCSTASELATEATYGVATLLVEQTPETSAWPASPAVVESATTITGLDHVVIATPQPERAAALYGARLGLEMKLDRSNPEWGSRLLFFRCGDLIVELAHDLKKGLRDGPDHLWGLSWRTNDLAATHQRLRQAGFDISDIRTGRKPGTRVFTVRDQKVKAPTLVIGRADSPV